MGYSWACEPHSRPIYGACEPEGGGCTPCDTTAHRRSGDVQGPGNPIVPTRATAPTCSGQPSQMSTYMIDDVHLWDLVHLCDHLCDRCDCAPVITVSVSNTPETCSRARLR